MRALIYKVSGMLSMLLILFSALVTNAQTQEQIDEVNAFEQKIEINQNNPGFDMQAAQQELNLLKEAYGMIPASTQETPVTTVEPTPGTSLSEISPVANNSNGGSQAKPVDPNHIPTRVEEINDQINMLKGIDDPRAIDMINDLQKELEFVQNKDNN